jgi:Fe-S cluster assembly ATP-binding protein
MLKSPSAVTLRPERNPAPHSFPFPTMSSLEIRDLHVAIGEKEIVKGLSLTINSGEVHAIMGPTAPANRPSRRRSPAIRTTPSPGRRPARRQIDPRTGADERARAGHLSRLPVPERNSRRVSIANFLRAAQQARMAEGEELDASAYYKRLYQKMDMLKIDRKFTSRSVNDGFSGGEKKRCEILQMAMLEPKFALMDETDSGLDIDALRIVAEGVNTLKRTRSRGAAHHPLSAAAELHRPGLRARHVRRSDREERRQVASHSNSSRGATTGSKRNSSRLSPHPGKDHQQRSLSHHHLRTVREFSRSIFLPFHECSHRHSNPRRTRARHDRESGAGIDQAGRLQYDVVRIRRRHRSVREHRRYISA